MKDVQRDHIRHSDYTLIQLAKENNGLKISRQSDNNVCYICKADVKLIKHHVKYDPEIIIEICNTCHKKIHNASWGWTPGDRFDEYEDYNSPYRDYVWYSAKERNQHYKFNEVYEQIRKFCVNCGWKTLVLPGSFETRCSACGQNYPAELQVMPKTNKFWEDGNDT